jgi:hypothetical protein
MAIVVGAVVTTPTIGSLADEVIARVENRVSDKTRAEIWLRDALLEISANPDFRNEFVELEENGPDCVLSIGQAEYDEALFVNTGDVNLGFLNFRLWLDPPTNSRWRKLESRSYQYIDKSSKQPSTPSVWYRFKGTIGFDPPPDKTYQVRSRYYLQHPIDDTLVGVTQILLPRDWLEVLVLSAAERGFMELLEFEKATTIHMLLHGDPKHPTRLGLLAGRIKKREREDWRHSRALKPVKRAYTLAGRY